MKTDKCDQCLRPVSTKQKSMELYNKVSSLCTHVEGTQNVSNNMLIYHEHMCSCVRVTEERSSSRGLLLKINKHPLYFNL